MYFFAKNLFFGLDKLKKCATLIRVTKLLRRGCRAVRQRSAKSRTPVRFRSTPPFFLPSIIFHQVHFRNMSVFYCYSRLHCIPVRFRSTSPFFCPESLLVLKFPCTGFIYFLSTVFFCLLNAVVSSPVFALIFLFIIYNCRSSFRLKIA